MKIIETSKVGEEVLKNRGVLIIGISICNSYFGEENLQKIIVWAIEQGFTSVYIMIPDEPAVHTLMAVRGYAEGKAKIKSRLQSNALENKCKAILNKISVDGFQILRWGAFDAHPAYIEALQLIRGVYACDTGFKDVLQQEVRKVFDTPPTDLQISIAVEFLFKELAFICYSSKILNEPATAYLYHKTMPVMKEIMAGKHSFKSLPNVGFITAK